MALAYSRNCSNIYKSKRMISGESAKCVCTLASTKQKKTTKKCTTMYRLEVRFGALFTGGKERRQNCPCAQLVNHHDIKTY
jgi:hypothetical protein